MFKKLMITCNEATTICDKNQYDEATFLEKVKLNIHLIFCRICCKYTKQNITLTKIYKEHAKSCSDLKHSLSDEDKLALKKHIESNII